MEYLSGLITPELFTLKALGVFWQIIFIDLVLAGDNAIIVGMVASRVPAEMRQKVIFWGIGAAVVMRIGFSLITVQLMAFPGIKLIGGLLLLWVCWRLWVELKSNYSHQLEEGSETAEEADNTHKLDQLRPAVIQIVIADLSMSIDNVIAIAGVSHEFPILLVFGLALSVAFMVFAATKIADALTKYPWIAYVGLVFILYVAVKLIYAGAFEVIPGLTA